MNPAILICSGPSRRDGEARGQILTVPCAAARANHNSYFPTRVAIPRHREPARDRIRVGRGPALLGIWKKPIVGLSVDTANPARLNSRQPFGAGNRIPGSPSVHDCRQSRYVRCPFTHGSFLSAPRGLVVAVYGHHSAEREIKCPTKEFPGAEIVFPRKT